MKALGIIFSNIDNNNIEGLTRNRNRAAVPFGGRFRLVDFVLSNMVNSSITKVGIIAKEKYQSLMDHIGSGKNWDLSRKNGGITIFPPYATGKKLFNSRFEAVKGILPFLTHSEEDYVVMSDCENVCNMDYQPIIREHVENKADITVMYKKQAVTKVFGSHKTVFDIDGNGKVIKTTNLTRLDGEYNVFVNIFIISRKLLIKLIELSYDNGMVSFTRDMLVNTDSLNIYSKPVDGYFATIDSMQSYYDVSMSLLEGNNRHDLFAKNNMNIYTKVYDSAPLVMGENACVNNSLISDGCVIEGTVKNSILARGVKVARGAVVENSILLKNTVIGEGSKLNCVVGDKDVTISSNVVLSGHPTHVYFINKGTSI